MATSALCGVMRIGRIHTFRQLLEAGRHNKRERLQPHIDPERVRLNYALAGPDAGHGASLAITHATRAMLRAAGRGKGRGLKPLRKNVVLAVEVIFSLPPGFNAENHRAYFNDCLAWMGRHFCDPRNILSADVHLDEGAPHMHVLVLPLLEGRMQGGKVCGSPAQLNSWRETLYTEVGIRHGLSPPAQKLRGEDKAEAVTMVLAHYRRALPALLNDPTWPAVRRSIELDPGSYMRQLGLEVAPRQKRMRTMAQIFTSNGKGPAREPSHAQRVAVGTKTLCSVAIDEMESFEVVPTLQERAALPDVGLAVNKQKAARQRARAPDASLANICTEQVHSVAPGGLVAHLDALGIGQETQTVEAAKETQGDHAVIVSNDRRITGGRHQAVTGQQEGDGGKAIVLGAPVDPPPEGLGDSHCDLPPLDVPVPS
ncbi:plasmid recombination protein [Acidovorax sp. SDU_ACID1]|uniref:plasmid recombination protein n=1 Tax=Acidovorax sp. SDU_ACID1 TaxID=3136632 RepID=UPI0038734AA8